MQIYAHLFFSFRVLNPLQHTALPWCPLFLLLTPQEVLGQLLCALGDWGRCVQSVRFTQQCNCVLSVAGVLRHREAGVQRGGRHALRKHLHCGDQVILAGIRLHESLCFLVVFPTENACGLVGIPVGRKTE
jgi:hypothetical protein